jgi:hypothetical protein
MISIGHMEQQHTVGAHHFFVCSLVKINGENSMMSPVFGLEIQRPWTTSGSAARR